MCDDDGIDHQKKPRLFMEWESSGEPAALIAESLDNLAPEAVHGLLSDLRELMSDGYADGESVTIYRKDMTDDEVAALPDL